jgi:hypothetical protein
VTRPLQHPPAVRTAFRLWLAAAAAGLASNLLALATVREVTERFARRVADQTRVDHPNAIVAVHVDGSAVPIVFALVLVALWVAAAFAMRRGANWARILMVVLGALGVLVAAAYLRVWDILLGLGAPGIAQVLLSAAEVVLVVTATVYLFSAGSRRYFRG